MPWEIVAEGRCWSAARAPVHLRPDKWSVNVAIMGGPCNGVLSLTSAMTGGLSGVSISMTTVPTADNRALGLTLAVAHEGFGSTLQLALSLSGMAPPTGQSWRCRSPSGEERRPSDPG